MRRGPASGRFLPTETADAVPLLMPHKNPAAVALGKRSAAVRSDRQRARLLKVMAMLRQELRL